MNEAKTNIKIWTFGLCLLVSFFTGTVLSGFFFCGQGSGSIGELDHRYDSEHGGATEAVRELAAELDRERELNRRLREHNIEARKIAGGLTETVERNVRNLQDAIDLIGEIRKKIKVLEDFYNNSDTSDGSN